MGSRFLATNIDLRRHTQHVFFRNRNPSPQRPSWQSISPAPSIKPDKREIYTTKSVLSLIVDRGCLWVRWFRTPAQSVAEVLFSQRRMSKIRFVSGCMGWVSAAKKVNGSNCFFYRWWEPWMWFESSWPLLFQGQTSNGYALGISRWSNVWITWWTAGLLVVVDSFCICMWQGQKCNPSLVRQQFWCLTPSVLVFVWAWWIGTCMWCMWYYEASR